MKAKKWTDNFNSLEIDQQIKVAKAIAEELQFKGVNEDENPNDELTKEVSAFFNSLLKHYNTKQDLNEFKKTLNTFQKLSPERQDMVVKELTNSLQKYNREQKKEQQKLLCKEYGHHFGKWEYETWTTYSNGEIDHQKVYNMPSLHERWYRVCSKCGYVESLGHEPDELRIKREEKETVEQIKRLEEKLVAIRSKH